MGKTGDQGSLGNSTETVCDGLNDPNGGTRSPPAGHRAKYLVSDRRTILVHPRLIDGCEKTVRVPIGRRKIDPDMVAR